MRKKNTIYREIYSEKSTIILPDAAVIPAERIIPATEEKFSVQLACADDVLFPEAANSLQGARKLNKVLADIIERPEDPGNSFSFEEFEEFGVPIGSWPIVESIINNYLKKSREMNKKGLNFSPGVQFNLYSISEQGLGVTLGNYGIFAATLLEAAGDQKYKKELIDAGESFLGNRNGFFVNPPATNCIIETEDGYIVFANRGNTAEYPFMYHCAAAGHHNPEEIDLSKPETPLEDLVAAQIKNEIGLEKEHIKEVRLNGIAFSYGSRSKGTEKAEILTYAGLDCDLKDIVNSIKSYAEHRWETRQLLAVPKENIGNLIKVSESLGEIEKIPGLITYFKSNVRPGTDPSSASCWVPVGLANMRVYYRNLSN